MLIVIGEVLIDVFPKYSRMGGAPFNFAFHLTKLGVNTSFVSRIGNDERGNQILNFLSERGFNNKYIQIDENYSTGKVLVSLDKRGLPQFDIVSDVAYDFIDLSSMEDNDTAEMIYFGSLIQRTDKCFNSLHSFLEKRSSHVKTFYDINLRPGCYKKNIIVKSLEQTNILKLNSEELYFIGSEIVGLSDEELIVKEIIRLFDIDIICLTKGDKGSCIYTPNNNYSIDLKSDSVIDTVGAGDAYAAILAYGYLNKWSFDKIMNSANYFSSRICQIKGALPDSDDIYEKINLIEKEEYYE